MRKGRYTGHEQALPEEVTLIAVGPINKGRTPELAHGGRAASQLVLPHRQPKTHSRWSLDSVKNFTAFQVSSMGTRLVRRIIIPRRAKASITPR